MSKLRDWEIRCALRAELTSEFKCDEGCLIIDEFTFHDGKARADIAVVNGALHGYEIKSDADSLERLEKQAQYYTNSFEYVTIVLVQRFLVAAINMVPEHFGIMLVSLDEGNNIVFKQVRPACLNKVYNPNALVRMLWRDELLELLAIEGLDKGLRTKPKYLLYDLAAERLDETRLAANVRAKLQCREDWRSDAIRL